MDVLDLLKLDLSDEQLEATLSELSASQLSSLQDSAEYYLLLYPQGTGNADLEELLEKLSLFFYGDD